MGSARPELLKNKEALAAVTKEALVLSEASGLDLTTATESLAKAMNQFNVPANEAARVINALAAGSKEGAMEVPEVAEAIKNMGTAASMANISLESSVALIETLSEKGFAGAQAGTMLRNVILRLQTGADKFNPAIHGMSKALENLAAENLSAAELTQMFGLESQQAAAVLIQNRQRFDELTLAVTGTNTAYEQQAIVLDTLEAQYQIFKNTIGDVAHEAGGMVDKLKGFFSGLTEVVKGFNTISDSESLNWFQKLAMKIGVLQGNTGSMIKMTTLMVEEQTKAKEATDKLTESVTKLNTAIKPSGDSGISVLRKETEALSAALSGMNLAEGITMPDLSQTGIDQLSAGIQFIERDLTLAQIAAQSFGEQMMIAGIQGSGSMKEFGKVAVKIAKQAIASLIATGVAGAVSRALTGAPFPFNLIAAPVAGATAAALFNAAIPEFAMGGGVSGPTLAMVGEAPGISRSNPEYIGTAKQLGLGSGGGTLKARVSRGDLLFILNEGKSYNSNNF